VLEHGGEVIEGFRLVDVKAMSSNGKEHPVDSEGYCLPDRRGAKAFRSLCRGEIPVMLKPIREVKNSLVTTKR